MNDLFSLDEQLVLKVLGKKKMSITDITREFYIDEAEAPIDPNVYIANVVRRIIKKCDHHNLSWTLKGQGAGRGGRTVWKDKRD